MNEEQQEYGWTLLLRPHSRFHALLAIIADRITTC